MRRRAQHQRKRLTAGKILRHNGQQRPTGTQERQASACHGSELPITDACQKNTPIKWVAGSTNSCSVVLKSNCCARETLLHVLGEHFSLHRFELTKSPMYVDISFRNCVLAKRTLIMAMTEYFAVEKNEALLSQLPASSPMCHLGLFSLHAITARRWHSPTGPRIQQVPLTYTHNRLPCTFLARVLRHAWRCVWKRTIAFITVTY